MPAVSRPDGLLHRLQVAKRDDVEPVCRLTKALQVLFVTGSRNGGERAPMKGTLEGDDAPAFGMPGGEVKATGKFDGAFAGFRPGVAEEHLVGKGCRTQPIGKPLLAGHAIKIGGVPQFLRLLGERGNQLGMSMTQGVHGDAAAKIQVTIPVRRHQPGALAAFEDHVLARVGGHDGRRRRGWDRLLASGMLGWFLGGSGHGRDLSGDTKRKRPRLGAALFDDPATVRHRSRANARTPGRRLRWIE